MVRYKRYKRRYKNTTNLITMKFQSFMDIHTVKDEMQIIPIPAGGKNILERLPAQFSAYKYYKIGNISVKLVPASTLPVDPTGLSYGEGEQTVDPRDQLTPGMMRITNGEDVFEDITNVSASQQHAIYNNMLLDPRWFKWMLQSGVKRHATPRYWQIGQLHQDKWPGAITNVPQLITTDGVTTLQGTSSFMGYSNSNTTGNSPMPAQYVDSNSDPRGFFQVGHRGVLGWLPTDGLFNDIRGIVGDTPLLASPPEIEVMKIILPPAYKTEYYYRMFISETVYFREPIMYNAPAGLTALNTPASLDVFHRVYMPEPRLPNQNWYSPAEDPKTGGNYGDD